MIGVIPCASKKLSVPAPAFLLYSASPLFSGVFLQASKECDKVFVLSALYGLIAPERIIAPYDCKMTKESAVAMRGRIAEQLIEYSIAPPVRSYCSELYNLALSDLDYSLGNAPGNMVAQSKARGHQGSVKGTVFPLRAIIEELYRKQRMSKRELIAFAAQRWHHPSTQRLQVARLLKSPFAIEEGGMIKYAFATEE